MNLHNMKFPLIFGEANFFEVPIICKIHEIYSPRKRAPYGIEGLLRQKWI